LGCFKWVGCYVLAFGRFDDEDAWLFLDIFVGCFDGFCVRQANHSLDLAFGYKHSWLLLPRRWQTCPSRELPAEKRRAKRPGATKRRCSTSISGDVKRFCSAVINDLAARRTCMKAHRDELSTACKAALVNSSDRLRQVAETNFQPVLIRSDGYADPPRVSCRIAICGGIANVTFWGIR